ncbi:hypothetical protein NDU88_002121 [Pleurodeles waltl]|uniref:Uncharacterized protein n=1 Tax=Pleurodeles waltl TaxID=8319 RepID=A0AAV7NCR2_PLEWA|nr:hypothetical protein NDU88_002121 [Pleurodeles waltl]
MRRFATAHAGYVQRTRHYPRARRDLGKHLPPPPPALQWEGQPPPPAPWQIVLLATTTSGATKNTSQPGTSEEVQTIKGGTAILVVAETHSDSAYAVSPLIKAPYLTLKTPLILNPQHGLLDISWVRLLPDSCLCLYTLQCLLVPLDPLCWVNTSDPDDRKAFQLYGVGTVWDSLANILMVVTAELSEDAQRGESAMWACAADLDHVLLLMCRDLGTATPCLGVIPVQQEVFFPYSYTM